MNFRSNTPFPVYALPLIIRNAILEVERNVKGPQALAVTSAISAISLACQDKIDIRRIPSLEGPCSLFFISIAEANERKSSIDKLFMKPICDYMESHTASLQSGQIKYRARHLRWKEEITGVTQAIRANAKNGKSNEGINAVLEQLMSEEPIEPKTPNMIFTDATPEAICLSLHKVWPSAGIISDEGAVIFDSRTMNKLGMLNKLWDGGSLHVQRASTESYTVKDARLTISVMTQPKTFQKFLQNHGALARDVGFLARCLVSYPISTQGNRYIATPISSWEHLEVFNKRISEILNSPSSSTGQYAPTRTMLEFSLEAEAKWITFYNEAEADLNNSYLLADIKDSASKISENMARMAALFHFFEGRPGPISLETVNQAAEVCDWYLFEFKRLFGIPPEISIEQKDALDLEKWFSERCRLYPGKISWKKNDIAQFGPNSIRLNKVRREAALNMMIWSNKASVVSQGKTKYVQLNPAFFQAYQNQQITFVPQPRL